VLLLLPPLLSWPPLMLLLLNTGGLLSVPGSAFRYAARTATSVLPSPVAISAI
jgi:hypothetical protein